MRSERLMWDETVRLRLKTCLMTLAKILTTKLGSGDAQSNNLFCQQERDRPVAFLVLPSQTDDDDGAAEVEVEW